MVVKETREEFTVVRGDGTVKGLVKRTTKREEQDERESTRVLHQFATWEIARTSWRVKPLKLWCWTNKRKVRRLRRTKQRNLYIITLFILQR